MASFSNSVASFVFTEWNFVSDCKAYCSKVVYELAGSVRWIQNGVCNGSDHCIVTADYAAVCHFSVSVSIRH